MFVKWKLGNLSMTWCPGSVLGREGGGTGQYQSGKERKGSDLEGLSDSGKSSI